MRAHTEQSDASSELPEEAENYQRALQLARWLENVDLPTRVQGALTRSLNRIIEPSRPAWQQEESPLEGLDVAGFLDELQRAHGGKIGLVKNVGDGTISELRAYLADDLALYSAGKHPFAQFTPSPATDPWLDLFVEVWERMSPNQREAILSTALTRLRGPRHRLDPRPRITLHDAFVADVSERMKKLRDAEQRASMLFLGQDNENGENDS